MPPPEPAVDQRAAMEETAFEHPIAEYRVVFVHPPGHAKPAAHRKAGRHKPHRSAACPGAARR
jgi:hypothetical protein